MFTPYNFHYITHSLTYELNAEVFNSCFPCTGIPSVSVDFLREQHCATWNMTNGKTKWTQAVLPQSSFIFHGWLLMLMCFAFWCKCKGRKMGSDKVIHCDDVVGSAGLNPAAEFAFSHSVPWHSLPTYQSTHPLPCPLCFQCTQAWVQARLAHFTTN